MGKASREKWKKQLELAAATARATVAATTESTSNPVLRYLRTSGAFAVLIGIGSAVFVISFWYGILFIYLGLGIWIIDIWCERLRFGCKIFLSAIPIGGVILVYYWVWSPAPLEATFHRHDGNYIDGVNIGGIEWRSSLYSELRLVLVHQGEHDYENFDILLGTNLFIAKAGWISQTPPGCSLSIAGLQATNVRAILTDPNGKQQELPIGPLAMPYYRLYCDKFLINSTMELVFAIVTPRPKGSEGYAEHFGPKMLPQWATADLSYRRLFRPYVVHQETEFDKSGTN